MLLTGLTIGGVLLILLIVLNAAERVYLRRHAATEAQDLIAAQARASARGLMPDARDATPLLAETLDQDFFHDEETPPWWSRLRRRSRAMDAALARPAAQAGRPLSSFSIRRAGPTSPQTGAGARTGAPTTMKGPRP